MIKKAKVEDAEKIANLAILMWNSNSVNELTDEFTNFLSHESGQIFLKYHQDELVGFAQCQLRYDYVEGTNTSPVGYLEGIFVKESYRHNGYAKELLSECEKWAKQKGCLEFASDCELNNDNSFNFHMNMGFEEANRIICFVKEL
ncbi:MAG: GNAT family N-acetyltransferase [Eubacterium sp.]|nr:GNAT family N-acetyltransferase [Eubacterium sp.]